MEDKVIRIDIKSWLESRFDTKAGTYPRIAIDCPYCFDTKKRLYILTQDAGNKVKGSGWCHNETKRRDFYSLYRDQENLTDSETLEQLYTVDPNPKYGDIEEFLESIRNPKEIVEEKKPLVWPIGYVRLWGLEKARFDKLVPPYMVKRNLTKGMCEMYHLGYCDYQDYKFKGRVIVPIYQHGKLLGFQGRAMHPAITPKYLFNDGATAGEYLYNLDFVQARYDWVILVEGVFDVWAVVKAGFPNVVASFGKHLTAEGVKTLVRRFKRVIILWDDDAKIEIAELAEELDGMIEVFVSSLGGKDPDEVETNVVVEAITAASTYTREYYGDALIDAIYKKTK